MPRNYKLPRREKRVSFRVSPEEYATLEQRATEAEETVSAFVRSAMPAFLNEKGRIRKRPRRADDTAQTTALLMRIYRNVEGLQQWVTTSQSGVDAVSLMAHLVAVEQELDRVTTVLEQRA